MGTVSTIRLPDEHWGDLAERAAQLGLDRSELIRRYVAAGLREDARRYWEVPADQAAGTIELYRGPCPDAVGTQLEEWLEDHSLDDAAWAWLEEQKLTLEDPDVWALYCPAGEGAGNRYSSCLPVGTHKPVWRGVCVQCGGPGPTDDFCDTCLEAGAATEIPD